MDHVKLVKQLKTDTLARLVADLTDEAGWASGGWDESVLIAEARLQGHARVGKDQFGAMVSGYQAAL